MCPLSVKSTEDIIMLHCSNASRHTAARKHHPSSADRAPLTCIIFHPRLLFHLYLSVRVCVWVYLCVLSTAPPTALPKLTHSLPLPLSPFSSLPLLSFRFTHSGLGCYPFFGARDSSSSRQVGLTPSPLSLLSSLTLSPLSRSLRSSWMKVLLQRCCVTVFLFPLIFAVEQTCFDLSVSCLSACVNTQMICWTSVISGSWASVCTSRPDPPRESVWLDSVAQTSDRFATIFIIWMWLSLFLAQYQDRRQNLSSLSVNLFLWWLQQRENRNPLLSLSIIACQLSGQVTIPNVHIYFPQAVAMSTVHR